MAMPLALVWDLIATDNASGVFKKVGAEAEVASASTKGLGTAFLAAGAIVGVAAVAIGAVSVKMAADFQSATTLLVTGAGESTKNIDMIKQGLLDMAPAVGIGPTALAKAMFMVESAGYHGAEGLIVMKAAAEGAKVGGADATVVANGLTTALTDYHLPASKAAEITSRLVATVAAGKTNMGELSGALAGVLPFASALGVGFNDIMGAMATMTSHGIDAATTSTMLKFTLMSLANETPKGTTALKEIGLSAAKVHDELGKTGLSGTLELVTEAIGKKFPKGSAEYTKALAAIVGGTRGMGATLALTGAYMKDYQKNIKDIGSATTEAGGHVRGWAEVQKDFNTVMDEGKALLSKWAVQLGGELLPALTAAASYVIDTVVPAVSNFASVMSKDLGGAFDEIKKAVAQFLSGFAMGRDELGKWGSPFAQFGALAGDIFNAIKGYVADFISGFNMGRTELGKWGSDFAQWGAIAGDAFRAIKKAVGDFIQGFKDGTGAGGNFRDFLMDVWKNALVPLAAFITGVALPALVSIAKWIIETGIPALGSFIGWIKDNKTTLQVLATFIGVVLLPIFADMAVKAVASAATQAGAWVTTQVAGVKSATSQVLSHYASIGGWVKDAAAATLSGGETAAIWLMLSGSATKSVLISIAAHVRDGAAWVVNAAIATAAGARMALAWLAALGPIGLIVAALGLVIAAMTWISTHTTLGPSAPSIVAPPKWADGTSVAAPGAIDWSRKPGHNALGTDSWRGGPTWVNEGGGEIIDLPAGSRVIPADKSAAMMGGDVVSAIVDQTAALKDAMGAMVRMNQTMQRQMAGAR